MNKIAETIFITATDVKINDKGKVVPVNGIFYWNGKNYKIENGTIKGE